MARKLLIVLLFVAIALGALYLGSHHGPNTGEHKLDIPGVLMTPPGPAGG